MYVPRVRCRCSHLATWACNSESRRHACLLRAARQGQSQPRHAHCLKQDSQTKGHYACLHGRVTLRLRRLSQLGRQQAERVGFRWRLLSATARRHQLAVTLRKLRPYCRACCEPCIILLL
jgi:hypothetical protein